MTNLITEKHSRLLERIPLVRAVVLQAVVALFQVAEEVLAVVDRAEVGKIQVLL